MRRQQDGGAPSTDTLPAPDGTSLLEKSDATAAGDRTAADAQRAADALFDTELATRMMQVAGQVGCVRK